MKTPVLICILCCGVYYSSSQNIQNHSGIDSIVRVIQEIDNCTISYDSSTFKNGYGAITCFYQNKENQKLVRVTEKTNLKTKNKKITRNYYFKNDNLIKVETEESSDCCGNETKSFYYSDSTPPLDNAIERGSRFYFNLAKVFQKSFYKKAR